MEVIQSISSVDVDCLAAETGNALNVHHLSSMVSAREVEATMPDRASSMPPYCSINYSQSSNFVDDMYAAISASIANSIPYKRSDCLKRLEIHGEISRPGTVRGRPHSSFRQNGRLCCGQQSEHPTNWESIGRTPRHFHPISTYPPSIPRSPSISASTEEQGDGACPSVSGRLSVSTLESGDVSVSCFHVGHHGVTCHPSLYIRLRGRDLLRRRKCMSASHRKQFYTAGAILIMIGITSVIVNVVGIVIHASWTFTGIGIWSGVCNIVSGWAAIVSAQQKFNDIGNCSRGLAVCSAVCSGFQIAFGVVGLTVRDFHYSLDMDVPNGTIEVNIALIVVGSVAFILNLWLAVLSCRSQEGFMPTATPKSQNF